MIDIIPIWAAVLVFLCSDCVIGTQDSTRMSSARAAYLYCFFLDDRYLFLFYAVYNNLTTVIIFCIDAAPHKMYFLLISVSITSRIYIFYSWWQCCRLLNACAAVDVKGTGRCLFSTGRLYRVRKYA